MSTTTTRDVLSTARVPLSREYRGRFDAPVVTHFDPAIFTERYFRACMECTFCHDSCCQYGCDVDLANVERLIGQFGVALENFVDRPRDSWFYDDVRHDPDLPGGAYKRSTTVNGACVFRNPKGRGCGIHAWCLEQGLDYHDIKPIVCWLFPIGIEAGALVPPNEVLDKTLICVDQGETLYRSQRGELLNLFGPELVAELDEMENQTLSTCGRGWTEGKPQSL